MQDAHTLQDAVDKLVPREEQERQAAEAQQAGADQDDAEAAVSIPEEDSEPAADSE